MKERPDGFLAHLYDNRGAVDEVGDYIEELHLYLWRVIRAVRSPGAGGHLSDYLDSVAEQLEEGR